MTNDKDSFSQGFLTSHVLKKENPFILAIFLILVITLVFSFWQQKNLRSQIYSNQTSLKELQNELLKETTEKEKLEKSFYSKENCQAIGETINTVLALSNFLVLDLPQGVITYKENNQVKVKINENEYRVEELGSPLTFGLCPFDEYETNCGYDDDKTIPHVGTFRVWKDQNGIFALNPQEITFDEEYINNFKIYKDNPNTVFSQNEVESWESILRTLRKL